MSIITVTDSEFKESVLNSNTLVLVDFWAEWCGPCKQLAPALEHVSNEFGDSLVVAKVDIDENSRTPADYGVRSIPTLMLVKDGEVVGLKVGVCTTPVLKSWIKENLS